MLCVVQKPFGGPDGRRFETNELIEAGAFRNRNALVDQRYLRLATQEEIASAVDEDEPVAPKPLVAKTHKRKGGR